MKTVISRPECCSASFLGQGKGFPVACEEFLSAVPDAASIAPEWRLQPFGSVTLEEAFLLVLPDASKPTAFIPIFGWSDVSHNSREGLWDHCLDFSEHNETAEGITSLLAATLGLSSHRERGKSLRRHWADSMAKFHSSLNSSFQLWDKIISQASDHICVKLSEILSLHRNWSVNCVNHVLCFEKLVVVP